MTTLTFSLLSWSDKGVARNWSYGASMFLPAFKSLNFRVGCYSLLIVPLLEIRFISNQQDSCNVKYIMKFHFIDVMYSCITEVCQIPNILHL